MGQQTVSHGLGLPAPTTPRAINRWESSPAARHRDRIRILDERVQARWFEDWRVGFPTDDTVIQRVAGWREHAGAWNDVGRRELRMMFGEADAL